MKIQIIISIIISIIFYLYFHFRYNKNKSQHHNNNISNIVNSLFVGLLSWFILDKCVNVFNETKITTEISSGNIYDTENSVENEQMIQNLADF